MTGVPAIFEDTQAHEFGHVGEELLRGYDGFVLDYGTDGVLNLASGLRGDELHDAMVVENYNIVREKKFTESGDMSLFEDTVYGPGTNPMAVG